MKKSGLLIIAIGGLVSIGIATNVLAIKPMRQEIEKYKNMSDKHLSLFLLMNQWVKIKQEEKKVSLYLKKKSYKKIAIYGMSYVGETLLNELRADGVQIAYAIDRQAEGIYASLPVVSPEDILEEVDAIVVTAVTFYEDIKDILSKKLNCPIISLEDILYEL